VAVASNVTVLATNGVALGIDYSRLDGPEHAWGFRLAGACFLSEGSPLRPNRLVRAHNVQEGSAGHPPWRAYFYDGSAGPPTAELRLRQTELAQLAEDGYLLYSGWRFRAVELTHCRVFNPSLVLDTAGDNIVVCGLTNSLWQRGGVQMGLDTSSTNVAVHLRNNLFRQFSLHFFDGTTNWTVQDNLFDRVILNDHDSPLRNSHNAYYCATNPLLGGVSNLLLTNLVYQAGPLGDYYLPGDSPLLDAGSRLASEAGLYHFTTQISQAKETNSVVDIGLHYVAVDATGQPLDSDGDGLPDYLEDHSGNGVADGTESDWQQYNSLNGLLGSPGLQVFTPLK
jgi:hypothetical protein